MNRGFPHMEINIDTNTPWFPFSAAKKKVNEFLRDPTVFGSNFQFHGMAQNRQLHHHL